MVQFFTAPTPRKDLLQEQLGASLGQGLAEFTGNYFANKSLQNVLNDPALKDAPISQKMGALQTALAPYGERGQRMLEQRLQTVRQGQLEQSLSKAKALMSDPTKTQQERMMGLYELAAVSPESAPALAKMAQFTMQQQQYGRTVANETVTEINPNASPHARAVAEKAGEDAAAQGGTPADVKKATTRTLTDIDDATSKLKRLKTPANVLTGLYRKTQGTHETRDRSIRHAQAIAKPLVEKGLIEDARAAISESGAPLEWTEEIVKPLAPDVVDIVKKMPQGSASKTRVGNLLKPPQYEEFSNPQKKQDEQRLLLGTLENVFTKDPNANIVLLRKAAEENGHDWRAFRDAIGSLQEKGHKFNPDQQKQVNEWLDQPPESLLDEFFRTISGKER